MENSKEFKSKNYVLLVMVALILIFSVVQSFQISKLKSSLSESLSSSLSGNSGGIDMSGWTEDEKMMYDHHGTLPSRVQGRAKSQGGMVGGC